MITCENCRNPIPDTAVICPVCGVTTRASQSMPPPQGYYPPQQSYIPPPPSYIPPQQGYVPPQQTYYPPQQNYMSPPQGYMPQPPGHMPPQQVYLPLQQVYMQPMYQPGVNVTVVNTPSKSNTPVIVEVLLNLFLGIYGVGWLIAGETTTGIVLLICSFVLYWPILIAIAVFTLGLGLFCDVPLWVGVVVLNAVLLNNTLNRKATQITTIYTR